MVDRNRLVYSSDEGRLDKVCPKCRKNPCCCKEKVPKKAISQVAQIMRSSKGRAGKTVTLISGLILAPAVLAELAATLRKRCGTGGTIRDGQIELQGDQREIVAEILHELGYKTKFAGG